MPKYEKPLSFGDAIANKAQSAQKRKAEQDEPFSTWEKNRTPENLLRVVDHHQNTIDQAVKAIVGPNASPLVQRRAQLMAAEAVQNYDPKRKVPLKHYIQSQLSSLRRYHAQLVDVVPMPERLRREGALLQRATEELWAKLDREPTADELADHTGISIKKQEKIRRRSRATMNEGRLAAMAEMDGGDDAQDFMPAVSRVDPMQELIDYAYFDMDPVDQVIYAHRTGYRGAKVLSNADVAKKLGISPGAVSQRAAKIEQRIQELANA